MKTMEEWFNLVEDNELREKLFYNEKNHKGNCTGFLTKQYPDFQDCVYTVFEWSLTPEKSEYWSKIATIDPPKLKSETTPKYKVGDKVNCIEGGKECCYKEFTKDNPIPSSKYNSVFTIISSHYNEVVGWVYQVKDTHIHGNWISEAGLSLVESKKECEWKEGDWVHIETEPELWSSGTGGKSPMNGSCSFPFVGKIDKLEDMGEYLSANISGFGFSIDEDLKIRKATPEEIQSVTKTDDSWIKPGAWLFSDNPYSSYYKVTYVVEIINLNHTRGNKVRVKSKTGIEWDYLDTVLEKYRPATLSEIDEYKHYYPEYDSLFGKTPEPLTENLCKEEYKVGDYVIVDNKSGGNGVQNGSLCKIESFDYSTSASGLLQSSYYKPYCVVEIIKCSRNKNSGRRNIARDEIVRKATQEEIDAVVKPKYKIGEYYLADGNISGYKGKIGKLLEIIPENSVGSRHLMELPNEHDSSKTTKIYSKIIRPATQEEIDSLKPKTEPVMDTKGWKVGDTLTERLLNDSDKLFFYNGSDQIWRSRKGIFNNDRAIEKFGTIGGKTACLITKTSEVWVAIDSLPSKPTAPLESKTTDTLPPGDKRTVEYWKQFIGRKVKISSAHYDKREAGEVDIIKSVHIIEGVPYFRLLILDVHPWVPGCSEFSDKTEQCILLPEDYMSHDEWVNQPETKNITVPHIEPPSIWNHVNNSQNSITHNPINIDLKKKSKPIVEVQYHKPVTITVRKKKKSNF